MELWLIKREKQWQTTLVNKTSKQKTKKLQEMSEKDWILNVSDVLITLEIVYKLQINITFVFDQLNFKHQDSFNSITWRGLIF